MKRNLQFYDLSGKTKNLKQKLVQVYASSKILLLKELSQPMQGNLKKDIKLVNKGKYFWGECINIFSRFLYSGWNSLAVNGHIVNSQVFYTLCGWKKLCTFKL